MQVNPAELRDAADTIGEVITGTIPMSPGAAVGASVHSLSFAAAGVGRSDTANALREARDATTLSIEVVRARIGAWVSSLTASAEDYADSDVESAQRLAGLGDLHDRG